VPIHVVMDHVRARNKPTDSPGEFVLFYSMGRLFNEYHDSEVYNYELQKKVCTRGTPDDDGK